MDDLTKDDVLQLPTPQLRQLILDGQAELKRRADEALEALEETGATNSAKRARKSAENGHAKTDA